MRHPVHVAAARRDSKLIRVRRLTLAISGWAAAATLGLGTVFAHALPGHNSTAQASTSGSTTTVAGSASTHRTTAQPTGAKRSTHRRTKPLAAPTQAPAPAPTPAAPVVSSGGS
jgi:hypothetical protein